MHCNLGSANWLIDWRYNEMMRGWKKSKSNLKSSKMGIIENAIMNHDDEHDRWWSNIIILCWKAAKEKSEKSIDRTKTKIWKNHLKKATNFNNVVAYNIAFQNSFDDILGDVIFEKSLETRISLKINVQFAWFVAAPLLPQPLRRYFQTGS